MRNNDRLLFWGERNFLKSRAAQDGTTMVLLFVFWAVKILVLLESAFCQRKLY